MKRSGRTLIRLLNVAFSPGILNYLDVCGVDRAVLINYVAPEVIGFTNGVNQFVADYVKTDPKRLISAEFASSDTANVLADMSKS